MTPTGTGIALALPVIAGRLAFGIVFGGVTGLALGGLLRFRGIVPEGLENIVALGFAVLIFETSNAVFHESGIAAVTVAGIVVGNVRGPASHKLAEFQEQLTVMLIGMLFVLLVADVRLADISALGIPGAVVAAACILVVRPLSVFLGTLGSDLTQKETIFVGWIGPRGIVAAAVASLFGYELAHAGIEGGTQLRALVFLVIAVTVLWSALTGGIAARVLGLRRKTGDGWVIVGVNALSQEMARLLASDGGSTLLVDQDPNKVVAAEQRGLRSLQGNALSSTTYTRMALDSRIGAFAVTPNEEVNYVFGEKAHHAHPKLRFGAALTQWDSGVTPAMIDDFGGEVLFGMAVDIDRWSDRIEGGQSRLQWWTLQEKRKNSVVATPGRTNPPHIPLVAQYKKMRQPVTNRTRPKRKMKVAFLIDAARLDESASELRAAGWTVLSDKSPGIPREESKILGAA